MSTNNIEKMSTSTIGHGIKHRAVGNDIFITPRALALKQINTINYTKEDVWCDPCRNNENGSYYSQFPTECEKEWYEILEGIDFFDRKYDDKDGLLNPDIICMNPPYSILDSFMKRCLELKPKVISMLIGVSNLTAKRIEYFEKAGYGIVHLTMLKVYKWYGMTYIVNFERNKASIMSIDRTVWREG
jgi:hypothetical protein